MITEANDGMDEAGLKPCDYYYAMFNYQLLYRKYGEKKNEQKQSCDSSRTK